MIIFIYQVVTSLRILLVNFSVFKDILYLRVLCSSTPTMSSSKRDAAVSRLQSLLHEWDAGSKSVRRRLLQDFIAQNYRKTGPDLESEFSEAASLFMTRITAWLRLTYMIGTCLAEQLQALQIFLSASSGHKFLAEFLEVGGALTVVEILGVKQARESDKAEALRLLACIAAAGRQYKELVCESYGVRATAECLARSRSEVTQECARHLLQMLAEGNPKFQSQVYRGLIALLPCSSAKAQHMAAQTLRIVQPIVETAHPSIVDPVLNLLKTLHLEVQFEALELIQLLVEYEVRDALLEGLVQHLRPSLDDTNQPLDILTDEAVEKMTSPLPIYVQQAASAKCIGILARSSSYLANQLLQLPVISNLMFAMGNMEYADSQRQASITLENFCRVYPEVDSRVHTAMGDTLYDRFVTDAESLYMKINAVQADILVSNKITVLHDR